MRLYILFFIFAIGILGCASSSKWDKVRETQDRANPRGAAYAADGFTFNKKNPEREFIQYEFYYKHCHLVTRNPYPTTEEHQCTEPY